MNDDANRLRRQTRDRGRDCGRDIGPELRTAIGCKIAAKSTLRAAALRGGWMAWPVSG
jgi:hypothetical protein